MQSSVVALNDQAIALMQQESYREAVNALMVALRRCMMKMAQRPAADEKACDEQDSSCADVLVESVPFQKKLSQQCADPNSFYMFDRALVLRGSDKDAFSSSLNEQRTSATLLYNLGLAHHLMGILACNEKVNLKKALKMYEMAVSIVVGYAPVSSHDLLLRLAIFNNKGHIHSNHMETEDVQECLSFLRAILNHCPLRECMVLPEEHLIHFHMNVMLLHGQHNHAPAA